MQTVPAGSAWRVDLPLAPPPVRVAGMVAWWQGPGSGCFAPAGAWDGNAWRVDAGMAGDDATAWAALSFASGKVLLAADMVAKLAGGCASLQWLDSDGVALTIPDRDALVDAPPGDWLAVETLFAFAAAHAPRQNARSRRMEAALRAEQALEAVLTRELADSASTGGFRRLQRPDQTLPGEREGEAKAEAGVERALVACRERVRRLEAAASGSPFIGWTLR